MKHKIEKKKIYYPIKVRDESEISENFTGTVDFCNIFGEIRETCGYKNGLRNGLRFKFSRSSTIIEEWKNGNKIKQYENS